MLFEIAKWLSGVLTGLILQPSREWIASHFARKTKADERTENKTEAEAIEVEMRERVEQLLAGARQGYPSMTVEELNSKVIILIDQAQGDLSFVQQYARPTAFRMRNLTGLLSILSRRLLEIEDTVKKSAGLNRRDLGFQMKVSRAVKVQMDEFDKHFRRYIADPDALIMKTWVAIRADFVSAFEKSNGNDNQSKKLGTSVSSDPPKPADRPELDPS